MGAKTDKWWGYLHIQGRIQAKRYFGFDDIHEAKQSPFVKDTFGPFEVPVNPEINPREYTINKIQEQLKSISNEYTNK